MNTSNELQDSQSPTILIVDDEPENLTVLSELLLPHYQVRAANSGEKALRIASASPHPDLVMLDVMMPGMDGWQVASLLRNNPATRAIPIIFVTAMTSVEAESHGLELGAVDYLTKPIIPQIVLARVRIQLELKQARELLQAQNAWLEKEVMRRMGENELIKTISIRALAHLAETRDPETGNHILRTQGYVRSLATRLQNHPRFKEILTPQYIELLTSSAPLHDIGKVGIPDHILLSGPLTPEEWLVMKTHASIGAEAIEAAEKDADQPVAFLALAKEISNFHHEKWDGSGYPQGRVGDNIPLSARIMAVADVFDAFISPRVYKPALPYEEAKRIIAAGRSSHFDPDMVDAFLDGFDEFVQIAERYRDVL